MDVALLRELDCLPPPRPRFARIELEHWPPLEDGLLEKVALAGQEPLRITLHGEHTARPDRFELQCSLRFAQRVRAATERDEQNGIPVMRVGVALPQLDGALEFALGGGELTAIA